MLGASFVAPSVCQVGVCGGACGVRTTWLYTERLPFVRLRQCCSSAALFPCQNLGMAVACGGLAGRMQRRAGSHPWVGFRGRLGWRSGAVLCVRMLRSRALTRTVSPQCVGRGPVLAPAGCREQAAFRLAGSPLLTNPRVQLVACVFCWLGHRRRPTNAASHPACVQ
jgi:hypothetical protein